MLLKGVEVKHIYIYKLVKENSTVKANTCKTLRMQLYWLLALHFNKVHYLMLIDYGTIIPYLDVIAYIHSMYIYIYIYIYIV